MHEIELTHTGLFHLERLERLLADRYNQQFYIEDGESLLKMMSYTSRLQDQDIQREFLLFYLNCGPEIQEMLKASDEVAANNYIKTSTIVVSDRPDYD